MRRRKSAARLSSASSSSSSVFLPLFTLQGFEGKMFSPLAFTISFALLGSLIFSITLVPTLCTFFLKQKPHIRDPFHIRWLKQSYQTTLKPCVRHPWLVVAVALLALAGSFALIPRIGTEFLPSLDEGSIAVQTFRIPSISLTKSLALQGQAEKLLKQFPEVIDVVSKTGRADIASDPMGIEISDVIVTLKPHEEWTTTKSKEELVEKMREALSELPGVASSFSQPIALRVDELVSGVKSAIGIKIFGEDLDVLKRKADAVARVLGGVNGAADINVEKVSGLAYLQIEINRDKIARYGINVSDIQDVIETAIGGKEASKVYEGLKVFGLAVRFPEEARNDVESIKEILIPSPSGALIPLGQLAHVDVAEGPAQISRESGQRRIVDRMQRDRARPRRIRGGGAKENRLRGQAAARLFHQLGRAVRESAARHETLRHRRADHDRARSSCCFSAPSIRSNKRRSSSSTFRSH